MAIIVIATYIYPMQQINYDYMHMIGLLCFAKVIMHLLQKSIRGLSIFIGTSLFSTHDWDSYIRYTICEMQKNRSNNVLLLLHSINILLVYITPIFLTQQ